MYIKGFDRNLCCRGMQFEIGKEYVIDHPGRPLMLCTDTGFHFCDSLQKVNEHYSCDDQENRFCIIEVLGNLVSDGEKCISDHIKIVREIKGEELNLLKGIINGNSGLFNTGDCNTGNWNAGDRNTGDLNTGNWNTGDMNTGYFNSCSYSTGFFNTKERTITIFNVDSGMTFEEFFNSIYFEALTSRSIDLTEWVFYTEEDKKNSPIRQCIGGYLKKYSFKEACANWWGKLTKENRKIIQSIPNFDPEIFFEITGIDLREREGNNDE